MFKRVSKKYSNVSVSPFRAYFSAMELLPVADFHVKYMHTENGVEDGDITEFPTNEFDSDGEMNEETAIQTVHGEEFTTNAYYDLQGRQLNGKKPGKGLYIHKGQKIVIK